MSRVEKQREGRCLGWKNGGREYVLGGKTTGGNMSGREFFRITCKTATLSVCLSQYGKNDANDFYSNLTEEKEKNMKTNTIQILHMEPCTCILQHH